jgi:type III secretion protein J
MRRVFAIALFFVLGCTVPVQNGLDEGSANEVITALERAGIGAEKAANEGGGAEGGGNYTVKVSRSDVARAMELMQTLGLPRTRRSGLAEMYGQPSLVPSPTEERARFLEALGNDIERTLETIEGVVSARVHLVLAESDPLAADPRPRVPAQAAVLLKTRAGVKIGLEESHIQRLVAGSVPGLQPSGVAVVTTPAPEWTGAGSPTMVAIGPIRMTPSSARVLIGAFVGVLAVVAIFALLLLYMARRLAAMQRERRVG